MLSKKNQPKYYPNIYKISNLTLHSHRYSENLEFYVEGGPVFIMIGGEAEASWGWLKYGQWYKWAQQHGAAMFLLEHRSGQADGEEKLSVLQVLWIVRAHG